MELSKITGGPDLGRHALDHVEYNRLRQLCSVANLALTSSDVDFILLAIRFVSASTKGLALGNSLGTLEATLATCIDRVITLVSQAVSKGTEIAAKTTLLSIFEVLIKMAEGRVSLMWAAICELNETLSDAKAACSTFSVAFLLAEARLETAKASRTSLPEEVVPLSSDNTRLDRQRKLAVFRSGPNRDLLDNVSDSIRALRKTVCSPCAQNDQEHLELRCEQDRLQARLSSFDCRDGASREPFRSASERLEAYRDASFFCTCVWSRIFPLAYHSY